MFRLPGENQMPVQTARLLRLGNCRVWQTFRGWGVCGLRDQFCGPSCGRAHASPLDGRALCISHRSGFLAPL
jgi:hypothetical protein